MITIRALLDRIRWDPEFGRADFSIGYFERILGRIIVVRFAALSFDPDDHCSFQLTDTDGQVRTIPLHRVCEVYRNGQRIWQRVHH